MSVEVNNEKSAVKKCLYLTVCTVLLPFAFSLALSPSFSLPSSLSF